MDSYPISYDDFYTIGYEDAEIPLSEEDEAVLTKRHAGMKLVCSSTKFANTVQALSAKHKEAISSNTGLGGLLHMEPVKLQRLMLVRIANRYDIAKRSFPIAGKYIPITPMDVHLIMHIPVKGEDINTCLEKTLNIDLFNAYQTKGKIQLDKLEEKIRTSVTPDDDFLRSFVLFAIGTILAPTANEYVSSKYLNLVEKVEDIPKFNWGCFTLDHLLSSIRNFKQLGQVTLQGNLPLLQFWYWEHVRASPASYSPISPPMMKRWDEANTKLRIEAYNSGSLDRGVVTVDILGRGGHNNTSFAHPGNIGRHAYDEVSYRAQPPCQTVTNVQMDYILQTVNRHLSEHEKWFHRKRVDQEHNFDMKLLKISDELTDIRREFGAQPRLSKLEDEVRELKKEIKGMGSLNQTKTHSTSNDAYVEEKRNQGYDNEAPAPTPRYDASTVHNSAGTSSAIHEVQNNQFDLPMPPRKPVFDNDYNFTDEDLEVAIFIKDTHDPVEVVDLGYIALTAGHLKPNVTKGFIFDVVIDAYARISSVENDTTAVIYTSETRKLLGACGGIPRGRDNPWVARIAQKFVGRRMVLVPFNVCESHWLLLVFNFEKEELQVLNSKQAYRDKAKETLLVQSIQACINEAVTSGFVSTTKPINITTYSCGSYTLKYMLSWDGDEMTENFNQGKIHIFSWKICTSLMRSNCNRLRVDSYKNPITKEDYDARNAKEPKCAEDDVKEIPDPNVAKESEKAPKRKRGRLRKNKSPTKTVSTDPPINTVKEQFATKAMSDSVSRLQKKSHHKQYPFVTP